MPERWCENKSHPLARRPRCWVRFEPRLPRRGVSSRCFLRRSCRKRVFSRPLVLQDGFGRAGIYGPPVTIWVFLSQCLSMDHSCRDAVARLITWRVARGLRPCSADTGAYCTARDSLPEPACHQLVRQTGTGLDREVPTEWRWHKRPSRGRRLDDHDAGHAGQPGRVSADGLPETGLRFSHRPHRRRFLVVGRNGARSRARKVRRQADGGEQPVSHASALSGHGRCRGG